MMLIPSFRSEIHRTKRWRAVQATPLPTSSDVLGLPQDSTQLFQNASDAGKHRQGGLLVLVVDLVQPQVASGHKGRVGFVHDERNDIRATLAPCDDRTPCVVFVCVLDGHADVQVGVGDHCFPSFYAIRPPRGPWINPKGP